MGERDGRRGRTRPLTGGPAPSRGARDLCPPVHAPGLRAWLPRGSPHPSPSFLWSFWAASHPRALIHPAMHPVAHGPCRRSVKLVSHAAKRWENLLPQEGARVAASQATSSGIKPQGNLNATHPSTVSTGVDATKKGSGAADDVFHVTPDGVVLPKGPKHKIPEGYVENAHRPSSYGEIADGKFRERLRIDPPTPPGRKGPNTSHYHLDGKSTHYSPAPGDKDPGFKP